MGKWTNLEQFDGSALIMDGDILVRRLENRFDAPPLVNHHNLNMDTILETINYVGSELQKEPNTAMSPLITILDNLRVLIS